MAYLISHHPTHHSTEVIVLPDEVFWKILSMKTVRSKDMLLISKTVVSNVIRKHCIAAKWNGHAPDLQAVLLHLGHCPVLRSVDLSCTSVADVSPLSALTGLYLLDLSYTPVADVSPLSALTGLHRLDLSCTSVADVSPLSALTGLHRLDLSCTSVADVSPLSALTGTSTWDALK